MNELTAPLIGIGFLIISLVIFFNWWQERKIKKIAKKHASELSEDVLLSDDSTSTSFIDEEQFKHSADPFTLSEEPPLNMGDFSLETGDTHLNDELALHEKPDDHDWNVFSEEFQENDDHSVHAKSTLPEQLNKEVDLIASILLSELLNIKSFEDSFISINQFNKSLFTFVLDEDEKWHSVSDISKEITFNKIAIGLQLADRSGPIDEKTLDQFRALINDISNVIGGRLEWSRQDNVLEYAKCLDDFCVEVDQTIRFNIVSDLTGRFTGTKFRGLAEACGLTLGDSGEYVSLSSSGHINFSVANIEPNPFNQEMLKTCLLKGISFSLDIPRTEKCAEAFNMMVLLAKKMQQAFSANLTDDRRKELSDHQIEKIRQQLKLIQTHMATKGVPSGSLVALRLFS
jgi:FtsZ-interacting cell division protein ZipA